MLFNKTIFSMEKLYSLNCTFKNYLYAKYTANVVLPQSVWLEGSIQEIKKYFRCKHYLYSWNWEVYVLQNGFSLNISFLPPGSAINIETFLDNIDRNITGLKVLLVLWHWRIMKSWTYIIVQAVQFIRKELRYGIQSHVCGFL